MLRKLAYLLAGSIVAAGVVVSTMAGAETVTAAYGIVESYIDGDGKASGDVDLNGNVLTDSAGNLTVSPSGSVVVTKALQAQDFVTVSSGKSIYSHLNNGAFYPLTTPQTVDSMTFAVGSNSRHIIVYEYTDRNTDFGMANPTNPTIVIQSADETTTTDRLRLSHNQTDGEVATDGGDVYLNAATDIVKLDGQLCASLPAAGTSGRIAHVTDATAGSNAALCIDDGAGWVLSDGSGNACCP